MSAGWIKLHRKIWKHPRAQDPEWVSVWLYLICHAAHEKRRVMFKGEVHELEPGQLVTGRKIIASYTGVNESKVRRVIKSLETDQQIDHKPCNKSSMFTVLNWQDYQQTDQQIDQQPTNSRPTSDQQATTEQEGEELKKEKKKEMSAKFKKPTVEELKLFAAKSGLADDAERFHDHFESNGWKVGGRGAMKNWEASYRNWSRNGINPTQAKPQGAFDEAW
tara:strand:+ start:67 stop:726 length:660 start_codon:yes stop_codon:yes gene_type:complete